MSERRESSAEPDWAELRLLAGRAAALLCLVLALSGTLGADISPEVLGIFAGLAGYSLGSSWLGAAAVVVSMVMLVLVLMRGYAPGVEPTCPGGFL